MKRKIFHVLLKRCYEPIRLLLEWEHFDRFIKIVSVVMLFAGGGHYFNQMSRNSIVEGNNNKSNVGDCCDNRSASGSKNVVGDVNVYVNGDLTINRPLSVADLEAVSSSMLSNSYVEERIRNSKSVKVVNKKPLLIKNPRGLDYLAQKARESLVKQHYSNAVELAHAAYSMIRAELRQASGRDQFHIEGAFVGNMERVYPVLIEEALSKGDFKNMRQYAEEYSSLFQDFYPYAEALKTIAETRKAGRKLIFFSPEKLRFLRALDKDKLTLYLSILSKFGYLQPVCLDYSTLSPKSVDYSALFGLQAKLPYQGAYYIRTRTAEGKTMSSNEISPQWCGFGQTEFVDIHLEASLAMGLPEKDRVVLPIKLEGESCAKRGHRTFSTIMVETRLSWSNSDRNSMSNVYEVIFKDSNGEQRLCQTNNTAVNTAEMVKVPEPSTSLMLIIGFAVLSLRRRPLYHM